MPKVLVQTSDRLRRVIDTGGGYYLEAHRGDTLIRRRGKSPIKDNRQLGQIAPAWKTAGFVRVHRNHSVNPDHILEVRLRDNDRDWEIKLAPPVNRILPVSRNHLKHLWAAFGQK